MESPAAKRHSTGDFRMSFLLDTDTCSAYLKDNQQVVSKVMLHFGSLHLSVVTIAELLTWARRASTSARRMSGVRDLLTASTIHDVDFAIADMFGTIRADLLDHGITVGAMDMLNASVALVHNLIVVTHNT